MAGLQGGGPALGKPSARASPCNLHGPLRSPAAKDSGKKGALPLHRLEVSGIHLLGHRLWLNAYKKMCKLCPRLLQAMVWLLLGLHWWTRYGAVLGRLR